MSESDNYRTLVIKHGVVYIELDPEWIAITHEVLSTYPACAHLPVLRNVWIQVAPPPLLASVTPSRVLKWLHGKQLEAIHLLQGEALSWDIPVVNLSTADTGMTVVQQYMDHYLNIRRVYWLYQEYFNDLSLDGLSL